MNVTPARVTRPLAIICAACCTGLVYSSQAQDIAFPNKLLRWVVPFPPGGSADIMGRMVGQDLAKILGQQVVIENRAGASAIVGSEYVAESACRWLYAPAGQRQPDGHSSEACYVASVRSNQRFCAGDSAWAGDKCPRRDAIAAGVLGERTDCTGQEASRRAEFNRAAQDPRRT